MNQNHEWLDVPITEDLDDDLHSLFWNNNYEDDEPWTSWGRKRTYFCAAQAVWIRTLGRTDWLPSQ